jgi:sporulation protein YlmC with PRC-barrel domain
VAELHLVRDLLDKQMVDRHGRRCGKVDGVVLRLGDGPPRVARLEIGGGTLARRLGHRWGRRFARWAASLARLCGVRGGQPYHIPWKRVWAVGLDVQLDLDARHTELDAAERRLRERLIARIPGA